MSLIAGYERKERTFAIFSWASLIVSVFSVVIINFLGARYNVVINRTLVFILLMLTLRCIQNPLLRNISAIILLGSVAVDLALQVYAWRNFDSTFTYGFALSVLNTTSHEAFSMLGLYWRDGMVFLGLFAILMLTANTGTHSLPPRFRRFPLIALVLLLTGYTVQGISHQMRKSNVESLAQRIVNSTPLSSAKVFMQANDDLSVVADISKNTPDYKISVTDTGIDTYVLIIGESARTANMGIYGYPKDTTPNLNAEKANLLLFRHAVSPAPVTIMAVPLALTADSVEKKNPANYGDNIISIANQAGFETHWYSRQGKGGAHNNVITGIALNTRYHQWVDEGYDDALLPQLTTALKQPGKKLIVLHLYGSHEPSCKRFPAEKALFKDGLTADDCYDNSVRFTDEVMGKIFSQLSASRASVLYFSDHALIRDPSRAVVYSHGGARPPREALEVPTFIWYSPKVAADKKWVGDYQTIWSTDDVNTLAELWLGIQRDGQQQGDARRWLQSYQQPVKVMDTTGKIYDWKSMK
jgi:glucan phosphoethanolaminetransferase (alkaline phosphatase superfamily)